MTSTPWTHIEAEVLSRIGGIIGDDEATAENAYRMVPKTSSQVDDGAFNHSAVRMRIVDVMMEIIGAICRTEGDPRRQRYFKIVIMGHGDDMPSMMGPAGAIYETSTSHPLVERSASEIAETRDAQTAGLLPAGSKFYYFAVDGNKFYTTLVGTTVTLKYFDYARPASSFTELDALFAGSSVAPIDDDLVVALADGAAGRLCMNAASYVEQGAAFLQSYYTALKEREINIVPADYRALPTA